MDTTPAPISLAAARELPWKPGRSAEAFVDGDLEIRFTPGPTSGLQAPHQRDELYIVASGRGIYRVEDKVTPVAAGGQPVAEATVICVASCGRRLGRRRTENQRPFPAGETHFRPSRPRMGQSFIPACLALKCCLSANPCACRGRCGSN